MKLTTFNQTTMPNYSSRNGQATIGMNFKTGLFNFSKEAVTVLKLNNGTNVQLHQDEEEPSDWYIEVVEEGGFVVRHDKDKEVVFFNNTATARCVRDCFEHGDNEPTSARFQLASEPIEHEDRELWGIIITEHSFKYKS